MSKSKKKYIVQNIDGGTIASNYVNRSSFVKVGSRKKRSESTYLGSKKKEEKILKKHCELKIFCFHALMTLEIVVLQTINIIY